MKRMVPGAPGCGAAGDAAFAELVVGAARAEPAGSVAPWVLVAVAPAVSPLRPAAPLVEWEARPPQAAASKTKLRIVQRDEAIIHHAQVRRVDPDLSVGRP